MILSGNRGYLSIQHLFIAVQRWRWMSGDDLNTINKSGHKKSPGYLNIKFDKEKNSEEAFTKLKGVLEGIGEFVR